MARAHDDSTSLRFGRRESERLITALVLSLVIHAVIWAGYYLLIHTGWYQKWHEAKVLKREAQKRFLQSKQANQEAPTIFVDVSHADADAPVNPKFYSNKNSHAANPDTANTHVVKINGKQTDMMKTEDVEKPAQAATQQPPEPAVKTEPTPPSTTLHPSMPRTTPDETAEKETTEAPQTPGETAMRKPEKRTEVSTETTTPSEPQPHRPRTLRQALAQRDQLVGRQMQQAGGAPQYRIQSSLDAKATPFGDYDLAIIEAVQQSWYNLLDQRNFADDRTGRVTLQFVLRSDGSVVEVHMIENTVGTVLGYLCQEAIEQAAPFGKWPQDMVRMIGSNERKVTFTFYYY